MVLPFPDQSPQGLLRPCPGSTFRHHGVSPNPADSPGPHFSPTWCSQTLPQWLHSRTSLQLPTTLPCPAVVPAKPGPPTGLCPSLASARPHPQGDARYLGLGLPQCPPAACSRLGRWDGPWLPGPGFQALPCYLRGAPAAPGAWSPVSRCPTWHSDT